MITRKTPALAGWLLDRFGVPQANESLMGDLVEERGSGRSALWFWRETFAAIAASVARDLREHKLLAVRAIVTGWALQWAWEPVWRAAAWHELWRTNIEVFVTLSMFNAFAWPVVTGWVVARTHRARQAAMVLAYAASAATYAAWDLTAHYSQIKDCFQCSPDPWNTNLALNCISLFLMLIGGFLLTPRPTIEVGTAS